MAKLYAVEFFDLYNNTIEICYLTTNKEAAEAVLKIESEKLDKNDSIKIIELETDDNISFIEEAKNYLPRWYFIVNKQGEIIEAKQRHYCHKDTEPKVEIYRVDMRVQITCCAETKEEATKIAMEARKKYFTEILNL